MKATIELSDRERMIAANLALGKTRKEVSHKLYIAPSTAVTHTKNIYAKTGCHNLADITRLTVAQALGKSIHDIDEAIRKYMLDLSHPVKLVLAAVFISTQAYIIYVDTQDMARTRTMKVQRTRRNNSKRTKENYYA